MLSKHFEALGKNAEDRVTGFKGVVSSIAFELYGCIQCVVTPPVDKDGKVRDGRWFDINRLKISGSPVMDVPDFTANGTSAQQSAGNQGCAEKTLPPEGM